MGKPRVKITLKLIQRWIKEGRGSGEGVDYKPWFTIQDVSSLGRCHRIRNCDHGRIHHLLSDLEERIFYLYAWSNLVIDIREQFPLLPQEETIYIAKEFGVKHPIDKNSGYPTVMTTDFLLTARSQKGEVYLARTAKYASALKDSRTLEKLEIERCYWQSRNVDWGIVTEQNLPINMFFNLKRVYPYHPPSRLAPLNYKQIRQVSCWLTKSVQETDLPLRDLTKESDSRFSFTKGMSINIVRHLIANKIWQLDLSKPLDFSKKMFLLNDPFTENHLF